MAEQNWKDILDPVLRGHLEHQLREVATQKNAYMNAPNSNSAQIWCSVAVLSKQIFSLNARLKQMEAMLVSKAPKKATAKKTTRKPAAKKTRKRATRKKK